MSSIYININLKIQGRRIQIIMIKNLLQFIYNVDGTLIDKSLTSVRAHSNYVNTIQIVAPWPLTDAISAEYTLYNTPIKQLQDYARLATNIIDGSSVLGKDVINNDKPYYQIAKDWFVWEIEIGKKALAAISDNHAGRFGVSFAVKETEYIVIATNDKGTFGSVKSTTKGDLPLTAIEGDYYRCDLINYESTIMTSDVFRFNEIAVYHNDEWIKGTQFTLRCNLMLQNIPVDPSMENIPPEELDYGITEQILDELADNSGKVAELSDRILVLEPILIEERLATVENAVEDIVDGTTTVDKAAKDSLGNTICDTYQRVSEKNAANGYVGLDANVKIPTIYIPDSILGQLEYAGVLNASTGVYPTLTNATDPIREVSKGDYFITNVAGTINSIDYQIGDWAVRGAIDWQKIDNTDAVSSVNGKVGTIILTQDNIGDGTTYKQYSLVEKTKLASLPESVNIVHSVDTLPDLNEQILVEGILVYKYDNYMFMLTNGLVYHIEGNEAKFISSVGSITKYVKADGAITKGDIVQLSGATGGFVIVKKAIAAEINYQPQLILGVAMSSCIDNEFLIIMTFGTITGINTLAGADGAIIYFNTAGTTPGQWTVTRPIAPNALAIIGIISNRAVNGSIDVRITNVAAADQIIYKKTPQSYIPTAATVEENIYALDSEVLALKEHEMTILSGVQPTTQLAGDIWFEIT